MPTISFANPKGGAGKTTSALLLTGELVKAGYVVNIIDADPEKWLTQWGKLPRKEDSLKIINDVTEENIIDQIETAQNESDFVIVDLEGTASLMVANAIGMSDLVIIPSQGASMDAQGASKTIRLIKNQEKMARHSIPYSVLLTRTSAAVLSRSMKNVKTQLYEAGIDVFNTSIIERAAYRDVFDFGGFLFDLDEGSVSNLKKACDNAHAFAIEVVNKLKSSAEQGA